MQYITLPVIVVIVGLALYGLTEGKPSEAGRIMFAFGLLVTLLTVAGTRLF